MSVEVIAFSSRLATDRGEVRDSIDRRWWSFMAAARPGTVCVALPNSLTVTQHAMRVIPISALILTGGDDIGVDAARDRTEAALLREAFDRSIPVIGICRGLQVIQSLLGGRVGVCDERVHRVAHHRVRVVGAPDSLARRVAPGFHVNSYHRRAVSQADLANPLVPLAVSEDGVIEAAYSTVPRVLAVQWHPERYEQLRPVDLVFFDWFLGSSPNGSTCA